MPFSRPQHGGVPLKELRSLGISAEHFLDFSVNINPLGPSPGALEALANLDPSSYPDPESRELREALADLTGVAISRIVIGNGSTELIHLLARTHLEKGDRAVILAPTFGEYETACRLAGAKPDLIPGEEGSLFRWDITAACHKIRRLQPRLTFLCNPNNPTGVYLEQAAVAELIEVVGDGLLVLDEAYISFVEEAWETTTLMSAGNLVILRSLTKDHALPGLRLGYALCPSKVADALMLAQPSWSVNAAAQAAGRSSLSDEAHLRQGLACASEGKFYLESTLRGLGLRVLPSAANFMLVEVGNGVEVRTGLLRRGFGVRDCTSFGLPRYIRIGARGISECQELVKALKEILADGPSV